MGIYCEQKFQIQWSPVTLNLLGPGKRFEIMGIQDNKVVLNFILFLSILKYIEGCPILPTCSSCEDSSGVTHTSCQVVNVIHFSELTHCVVQMAGINSK